MKAGAVQDGGMMDDAGPKNLMNVSLSRRRHFHQGQQGHY
jgi:hypothetical protein